MWLLVKLSNLENVDATAVAGKQEFGDLVYQEDQEPDGFGLVERVRHDDVEGHVAEVGCDRDEVE